jgi:hypothetical protein
MIQTSRISSGYDAEVQLSPAWFLSVLQELNNKGILLPNGLPAPFPPDAVLTFTGITILFDNDDYDLEIDVDISGLPLPIMASLKIDGNKINITTNLPDVGMTIPFNILVSDGEPVLVKLVGDADHEDVMAVLMNLKIDADASPVVPDAGNAQSFLPKGKDIGIAIRPETITRLGKQIWNTPINLGGFTDPAGNHPIQVKGKNKGTWHSLSLTTESGAIKLVLKGEVPIDYWPDADIKVTVKLKPKITASGSIGFNVTTDTDIDTGILGDIFGFLLGGVVGIIVVEVVEVVVEGKVESQLSASFGSTTTHCLCCKSDIVQVATMTTGGGIDLSALTQALPSSIPILTDNPDPFYKRTIMLSISYSELQIDSGGMGMAGAVFVKEKYEPKVARITGSVYNGDNLTGLVYVPDGGTAVTLSYQDLMDRAGTLELKGPVRISSTPENAQFRIPEGKIVTAGLDIKAIKRKNTIVTEFEFLSGLILKVKDTTALQNSALLVVKNFQFIRPKNGNPYYRAKANKTTEDNLEGYPMIEP